MLMVKMEKLARKVFKECQDLQVQWVTKDPLANLVEMVILALSETQAQEVILEKMDHRDCLVPLARLVRWENEVHLVLEEQEDFKECLELLVSLDNLEKMEMLGYLVNLV